MELLTELKNAFLVLVEVDCGQVQEITKEMQQIDENYMNIK